MEEDFDIDKITEKIDHYLVDLRETEKQGVRDILKYFDRIHDKLFSFNNMLIAGYFVIIALPSSTISAWWMFLPVFNMAYLIFIEYKMMEKSRIESQITQVSAETREKYGKSILQIFAYNIYHVGGYSCFHNTIAETLNTLLQINSNAYRRKFHFSRVPVIKDNTN